MRWFRRHKPRPSRSEVIQTTKSNLPWFRDLDATERPWAVQYIETCVDEIMGIA